MLKYAIVEISSKQYKITPETILAVSSLGDLKTYECEKVLLKNEDGKLEVGDPYLKDKLVFEVIENFRAPKIRVATYKPKANSRRVKGSRAHLSKIRLQGSSKKV